MRHRPWVLLLLFGLSSSVIPVALSQSHKPKPRSNSLVGATQTHSDPCYHRLSSTSKLASYLITIPPRGSTLLTPHPSNYLLLSLVDSALEARGASGQFYSIKIAQEEMQVIKGGWAHRLTNLGETPARLVEVDVDYNMTPERALCGLAAIPCSDGRFGKTLEGTYATSTLFETPTVKLMRVELGPSGSFERRAHRGPDMLIALTPLHLSADSSMDVDKDSGETQADPAGAARQIKNIGSAIARFLELEVK